MDAPVEFADFWFYHLVNYALAALMYSLLARFVLSFVFDPGTQNYIYRFLVRVTEPAVGAAAFVTPQAVPRPLVLLLAVIWILVLRFLLYVVLAGMGLAPRITG